MVAFAYASFSALSRSISRSCSRVVFLNKDVFTLSLQFFSRVRRCPYSGWSSSHWRFLSGERVLFLVLSPSVLFTRCWLASFQSRTVRPPLRPSSHYRFFTGFPVVHARAAESVRMALSWSLISRHQPISV